MREIPVKKRMEVLRLFFEGLSYEEIGGRVGVSKGSVVSIVTEFKDGRYPKFESTLDIVDELRDLAVKTKKSGVGVLQANLGLRFYERLKRLGVEPQALSDFVKLCNRISPPEFSIDRFVDVAIRLMKLEVSTGKSYEEALKELEEANAKLSHITTKVRELEAAKASIEKQIDDLEAKESRIRNELGGLTKGKQSLEKLGVDKVAELAGLVDDYEALGYGSVEVRELANVRKELAGIGIKPSELGKHFKDRKVLEQQAAKLSVQAKSLDGTVRTLKRDITNLTTRNRGLQVAAEILKSRITRIACSYCGTTVTVPIPDTWALDDSIRKGLVYPAKCYYCGYKNRIDPTEILASIGWSLLT
jgi:predicted transcriptional regulator